MAKSEPAPEPAPEAEVQPAAEPAPVFPPDPEPAPAEPGSDALYDWSRHLPDPEVEEKPALPTHKDDLVALAIDRGHPSYTAWALTVPELKTLLEN